MSKKVRKTGRLVRGERVPPPWVPERMAERPPWEAKRPGDWEQRTYHQRRADKAQLDAEHAAAFKGFIFAELDRRWGIESAKAASYFVNVYSGLPPPESKRHKHDFDKHWNRLETAARTSEMVREIFEDYWNDRWERTGPLSPDQLAAEYMALTAERLMTGEPPLTDNQVKRRVQRARSRRPQ